jgi:hypothetical protein
VPVVSPYVLPPPAAHAHRRDPKTLARSLLTKLGLPTRGAAAGDLAILVEARLEDGIGLHHFGLGSDDLHPFVRAVRAGIAAPGSPESEIRRVLLEYYARVTPGTAADWLDLPRTSAPPELLWAPPWAATMPWQIQTPAAWRAARERGVPSENRIAGRELSIEAGWHACGPVIPAKAAIEAGRLARLLASIQADGLIRHGGQDGDIDAVLLRGGGVQRWWVNSGHHRAAVLSALGYETAPIRIRKIVDLRDAAQWPQVASGLFQTDEARRIVERLLAGEWPRIARPWVRWVRSSATADLKISA